MTEIVVPEEGTDAGVSSDHDDVVEQQTDKRMGREVARLKKALAAQQERVQEYETYKAEKEREALSEQERVLKDLADAKAATSAAEALALRASADLERERLVSQLVAKGLRDPDYGDVLLRKFDAEKQTLDAFVADMKAHDTHKALFRRSRVAAEAPPPPGQGTQRPAQEDKLSDFAEAEIARVASYDKDAAIRMRANAHRTTDRRRY